MGGVAGLAAAYFLHGALVRMMSTSDPRFHMSFTLDPLVLAFALAATLAAALLFGALPAWQVTKNDAGTILKEQGRSGTGSLGRMRSGRFLVSLQLALSLPLLVGAGLLVRTVYNLQRADLGFPAERLLLVRVDLREAGYNTARRDSMLRELPVQFQRIPRVRAVSFSHLGVFSGGNSISGIEVEGYSPRDDNDRESAMDEVGPGYFSTLGVPIVLGREILESDQAGAPKICVINEAFAKKFFGGRNPIGMRITSTGDDRRTTYQVVGVAKNARTQELRGDVEPRYFVPAMRPPSSENSPTFLIRTTTETGPVMAAARKTIQRVDAALPIVSAESLEERMAPLTAQDRTTAQLAVVFGCVALTLAAIGLYGVLSYGIAQRRGEIAIRIALGAQRGRVVAMILRETSGLIIAGLALGAGLAYAASRLIDSQLYGVAPQDPLTLALAAGLLVLVALSASYLPARRASRLDPMAALRQE
jgi:predicted permease